MRMRSWQAGRGERQAGWQADRPMETQLLPRTLANFGRNTSQPSLPPQELLTAQNSMGGPPQYPGSRLGGGYVAPENNISSALSMDLVGQGLAHRVT